MNGKAKISRRELFGLGFGTAMTGFMDRNMGFSTASEKLALEADRELGKVKIRDVQCASIKDEYICNLIKITTDSGLFGIGEARPKIDVIKQIKTYKELVIGEDPLQVDYLTRKMMGLNQHPSKMDIGVIAGIETALWDLAGKILDTPTYNLLGGKFRNKVKVYYDLSPADSPKTTEPELWVECARKAKKAGFKAMKFDIYRGGGDVPQWVQILKAIRAEVGPNILLGVDFHWRLSYAQTKKFIAMVEPVDLWFVEDPMKYDGNLQHYQRLSTENKVPIVACEQMQTRRPGEPKSFQPLIENRICNIIEPDAQYCGGLLELKRVADWAELYGMNTLAHNMCTPVGTFAQAHACSTIPSFIAMENACAIQVIQHDGPLYEDGYLMLNENPGFGVELNEDYCKRNLAKGSIFFDK